MVLVKQSEPNVSTIFLESLSYDASYSVPSTNRFLMVNDYPYSFCSIVQYEPIPGTFTALPP